MSLQSSISTTQMCEARNLNSEMLKTMRFRASTKKMRIKTVNEKTMMIKMTVQMKISMMTIDQIDDA